VERLRYRIDWQPLPDDPSATLTGRWLVVVPNGCAGDPLVAAATQALGAAGGEVVRLDLPGPAERAPLAALLAATATATTALAGVLSLLALDAAADPEIRTWRLQRPAPARCRRRSPTPGSTSLCGTPPGARSARRRTRWQRRSGDWGASSPWSARSVGAIVG